MVLLLQLLRKCETIGVKVTDNFTDYVRTGTTIGMLIAERTPWESYQNRKWANFISWSRTS